MSVSYEIVGSMKFSERTVAKAAMKLLPELTVEPDGTRLCWSLRGTTSRVTLAEWADNLQAVGKAAVSGHVDVADCDIGAALRVRPKRQHVEVKLWEPSGPLQHMGRIYSMAIGGSLLALAGRAKGLHWSEVTIWDVESNRLVERGGEGATIQSMAWSPDGEVLALGRNNGKVSLWHIEDDVMTDVRVGGASSPVHCLGWSADGSRLVAAAKRAVVIDYASAKVIAKHAGKATSAAWLGERVVLAEHAYKTGPKISVADGDLNEVETIEPSSRHRWHIAGVPGAKAVWLYSGHASERMTPSLRRRRHARGGWDPVFCDQTGSLGLRNADEVRVFGKTETSMPLEASVRCYALCGQTLFLAADSKAVPVDLPAPMQSETRNAATANELPASTAEESPADPSATPTATLAHVARESEVPATPRELWRAFVKKHQPPWMTELPPEEPAAFTKWLDSLPEEAKRKRVLGYGWHWNETESGRDGAYLSSGGVTGFTECYRNPHGDNGGTSTFESFLEGGPYRQRNVPPPILVELLVAVWHHRWRQDTALPND